MIGIIQDISDIKFAEQALAQNEAHLKSLLNALPDLIFHFDSHGKFLSFHQKPNQHLYREPEVFLGKNIFDIFDNEFSHQVHKKLRQAIENDKSELFYPLMMDKEYFYHAKFAKLNDNEVIVIIRDITKLKETEKGLQELNATKDKFVSILAHDLKDPFNSLIGFSELLIKNIHRYDTVKIERFVQNINHLAKNTYTLLINLLEWSKAQQDKIAFSPEINNLHNLVQETCSLLSITANEKQIRMVFEIPKHINIVADPQMLKTVIRNIVSNAIKYTSANGLIHISANQPDDYIHLKIRDTGTGMSDRQLKSLFKVGQTTSTVGTKGEKGTGLGLLLCKEFIDKHHGTIAVESELGKGTTFFIKIPEVHHQQF